MFGQEVPDMWLPGTLGNIRLDRKSLPWKNGAAYFDSKKKKGKLFAIAAA
jgi:hypothetical protein